MSTMLTVSRSIPSCVNSSVAVLLMQAASTSRMGRFETATPAMPAIRQRLEEAGYFHAIRLPANAVLREKIAHRMTRPVGRPSQTRLKRLCETSSIWRKVGTSRAA